VTAPAPPGLAVLSPVRCGGGKLVWLPFFSLEAARRAYRGVVAFVL